MKKTITSSAAQLETWNIIKNTMVCQPTRYIDYRLYLFLLNNMGGQILKNKISNYSFLSLQPDGSQYKRNLIT